MERTPRLWSTFVSEFWKKFIPQVVREKKEEEFIGLKQKTLTVTQYEIQFTKLSKYAPDMVNTEEKRRRRFLQGLNIEIQTLLVSAKMDTYAKMVEFAQRAEDCYVKLREFQDSKRIDSKNWENHSGSLLQEPARQFQKETRKFSQKCPSEASVFTLAKWGTLATSC